MKILNQRDLSEEENDDINEDDFEFNEDDSEELQKGLTPPDDVDKE